MIYEFTNYSHTGGLVRYITQCCTKQTGIYLGSTRLNILDFGNPDSGILETDIPEEGNSLIGLFITHQVLRYCQAQSRFEVL